MPPRRSRGARAHLDTICPEDLVELIQPTRTALLLLVAALAACSDAPTGAAITAPDQPAAFNTAPTVTVTNSGGYPLISWGALAGATSYSVVHKARWIVLLNGRPYASNSTRSVGSTTGTSLIDSFSYTGVSQCVWEDETVRHEYVVTATFSSGTSTTTVAAPIAEC
ncbi:MAG TPA: hypothetical protein VHG35_17655 [Gemmatimonadales bacterium]|nr:hypothetical protein [Gemmatimonadales bacterium]